MTRTPPPGGEAARAHRRIAIVWASPSLRIQRIFAGVCQFAELMPHVTIRRFDVVKHGFQKRVLAPVKAWKPDGLLVVIPVQRYLGILRKALPRVPTVAAHRVAFDLADCMVLVDRLASIRLVADHFRSQGLQHVAFFSANAPHLLTERIAAFRQVVPDGSVFAEDLQLGKADLDYTPRQLRQVGAWLQSLPKPCGVMTFEDFAALHLVRLCALRNLRVPADIQIVGTDDADICLSSSPHITSLSIQNERVGETLLETLLRLIEKVKPRPPKIVEVTWFNLIPRGTTGPTRSASAAVANALHLMNANAARGINAAKVVRMTRAGTTNFYRQFQDATGKTPAAYLRKLRLEEACRLLTETAASVTAIAEKCGFSSANYFALFFRRETGLTPTAWRERKSARLRAPS